MVSIIVPIYNGAAYVNRCIDCILKQTEKNIQLIIINDGSTDETESIINSRKSLIKNQLAEFIYFRQDNEGVGAAVNQGLKFVTGDYLMLYDVDDILYSYTVYEYRKYLDEHPSVGTVRGNGFYVDEGTEDRELHSFTTGLGNSMNHDEVFAGLVDGSVYNWPGTYMVRVSLLDDIYPSREIYPSRSGQNLQILMPVVYKYEVGFLGRPMVKYVQRRTSLSHSGSELEEIRIAQYEGYKDIRINLINYIVLDDLERDHWLRKVEIACARLLIAVAQEFKDTNLMREQYRYLKEEKENDISSRLTYYRMMHPVCGWAMGLPFRLLHKLRLIK